VLVATEPRAAGRGAVHGSDGSGGHRAGSGCRARVSAIAGRRRREW
jgi:hypothetical protein